MQLLVNPSRNSEGDSLLILHIRCGQVNEIVSRDSPAGNSRGTRVESEPCWGYGENKQLTDRSSLEGGRGGKGKGMSRLGSVDGVPSHYKREFVTGV